MVDVRQRAQRSRGLPLAVDTTFQDCAAGVQHTETQCARRGRSQRSIGQRGRRLPLCQQSCQIPHSQRRGRKHTGCHAQHQPGAFFCIRVAFFMQDRHSFTPSGIYKSSFRDIPRRGAAPQREIRGARAYRDNAGSPGKSPDTGHIYRPSYRATAARASIPGSLSRMKLWSYPPHICSWLYSA